MMTPENYIKKVDRGIAEEVYAKLVALKMEYEMNKDSHFDPDNLKQCYDIALPLVKDYKFTKLQLCALTLRISDDLMQIGFNQDHLLKLVVLDL